MSDRFRVECAICWSNVLLDNFLIFKCGHGFCVPCIAKSQQQKHKFCPVCRNPISYKDTRPLYINVTLTDNSPSPTPPSKRKRPIVIDIDGDTTTQQHTASEVQDRKGLHMKIRRLAMRVEELNNKLAAAKSDAESSRNLANTLSILAEATDERNRNLCQELERRNQDVDGLTELRSEAEARVNSLQGENAKLQLQLRRLKLERDKLVNEIDDLQKAQKKFEKMELTYKKRNIDLRKQLRDLGVQNEQLRRHANQKALESQSLLVVETSDNDEVENWASKMCSPRGGSPAELRRYLAKTTEDSDSATEPESDDDFVLKDLSAAMNEDRPLATRRAPVSRFPSDWNLPSVGTALEQGRDYQDVVLGASASRGKFTKIKLPSGSQKGKAKEETDPALMPIDLTRDGKPKKLVALASRQRIQGKLKFDA